MKAWRNTNKIKMLKFTQAMTKMEIKEKILNALHSQSEICHLCHVFLKSTDVVILWNVLLKDNRETIKTTLKAHFSS